MYNEEKRHGFVVAKLNDGRVVSGIIDRENKLYYISPKDDEYNAGWLCWRYHIEYEIIKDLRDNVYLGQKCEFGNEQESKTGVLEAITHDGYYMWDYRSGDVWQNCKPNDDDNYLRKEIERLEKELSELKDKI